MTEKRFEINNNMNLDSEVETYELSCIVDNNNKTFYFIVDSIANVESFVERLNELHEEVQAQSIVIKGYQERNDKLFKENKQLKKEIEEKEEVIKFYHRFNRGVNDDL